MIALGKSRSGLRKPVCCCPRARPLQWPTNGPRHCNPGSIFSCTWGSNGPVERAGGQECYWTFHALHGEGPLGSREATRSTSNGESLRDTKNETIRCGHGLTRSGYCHRYAISIGCNPLSRPVSWPVVILTVTVWVNVKLPRRVPIPVPIVKTVTVVAVEPVSLSCPCITPLKGTCFCAAAGRATTVVRMIAAIGR